MKCFIIVSQMEDDPDAPADYMIATRRQFATKEDALKHLQGYAEGWRTRSIIVECPKGLVYAPGELTPLKAADPAVGTACVVDVTLDVQFAYKVDDWELGTITFEIPIEHVGVFLDGKLVSGAKVTGYTTTDNIEVTS